MLALLRNRVPELRLVHRAEVPWMRGIAWLMRPFNPHFDRFTIALGHRIYLPLPPERMPREQLAAILAHELVHQLDQARWGPWFYLSYALLLPLGRTWRAKWERRAYAVDLLLARERGGEAALSRRAGQLARLFAGPAYLHMWSGEEAASRLLAPVVEEVRTGTLETREPYRSILDAWRGPRHTPGGVSAAERSGRTAG